LTFPVPLSVLRAIGQSLIYGEVQLQNGEASVYHPRTASSLIKVGVGYVTISGTPGFLRMTVDFDNVKQMYRIFIKSTSTTDTSRVFYCLIPV
jgi:hypothetical protein